MPPVYTPVWLLVHLPLRVGLLRWNESNKYFCNLPKMNKNRILNLFWQQLAASNQAALLLDYDGTLAPFRIERDRALPYLGVREVLAAIRRETTTRVVIISGRTIDDLLPLLALDPPPEVWGCHGWEWLDADGYRPVVELPEKALSGLRDASHWVKEEKLIGYCEHKPASLAIHWRGLSDYEIENLQTKVLVRWQLVAERSGLNIHPFDGGLELRCPGKNKGTAVRSVLEGLPKGQPIAFLGDDQTDEDGFEALKGRGLGVLVRSEPRQTHADLQIAPPQELIDFFELWLHNAPRKETAIERGSP